MPNLFGIGSIIRTKSIFGPNWAERQNRECRILLIRPKSTTMWIMPRDKTQALHRHSLPSPSLSVPKSR